MSSISPLADLLPTRRGGRPSSETVSAAGRPVGFARLRGTRRGLVGSARAFAATLLALTGALALPATAEAQTATTLVSTVNQSPATAEPAPNQMVLDGGSVDHHHQVGQEFTTGMNGDGYILTGVDIVSASSTGFTAKVCDAVSHTANCTDLTISGSFGVGTLSFTAPADTPLTGGATYAVVLTTENEDSLGWTTTGWGATRATAEDAGAAAGWSIADGHRRRQYNQEVPSASNPGLSSLETGTLRIAIKGTVVGGTSSDATLSGLIFSVRDSAETALETVDLSPAFDPGNETYRVSVAYNKSQVTFMPAVNDAGATVAYFDGDDTALEDANTDTSAIAEGHQVDTAVGPNIVKVKVTASDGMTEKTYTVTVTRELPTLNSATVQANGTDVTLSFETGFPLGTGTLSAAAVAAFTVTADGVERPITDIVLSTLTESLLDVTLSTPIYKDQVVVVIYDSAAALVDKHGNKYQAFTTGEDGVPAATNNSTVVASIDATLSGLTVTADGTDLVTFASGTFDYSAMVGTAVAEVTVTATKNDTNATIEYLDGSDVMLDDADTGTAGHQVPVAVGDTVIQVKVTAQNTTTFLIYTVTVTREAPPGPPAPTNFVAKPGNEQVALSWDAPASDSGVTRHDYQFKTDGSYGNWTAIANSAVGGANEASHTVPDLTNEVPHTFQLRVVSGDGDGAAAMAGPVTPTPGICDRTQQVQDAILAELDDVDDCAAVTVADLETITYLDMPRKNVTALKSGDFAGLSALDQLQLRQNSLTELPSDLFSGLTALKILNLSNNALESLHSDVFSGLTAMENLSLGDNASLGTALPATVFSDLTSLQLLALYRIGLETIPTGLFSGLSELTNIFLDHNRLVTLPAGLFSGLTELTELTLDGNLTDPLPLTVTLEKAEDGQVRAKVLAGAPSDLVLPVSVENGTLAFGATGLRVAKGSVAGDPVSVIRTEETGDVTVDLGTPLPSLPPDHRGYEYVKAASGLPVEVPDALEREPGVEGQFRIAPDTVVDYSDDTLDRVNGHVGRAEVFHAGRWGTVSDDGLLRTDNEASALVCQAMDYTTGEFASGYGQPGVPSQPSGPGITVFYPVGSTYPDHFPLPIWLDDLSCVSGDTDLTGENALKAPMAHCGYAGWGLHNSTHSEDAGVRCWNEPESGAGRSYDPLTAAFEGLPEAHDGETAFSFRLAFSEAVAVTPEAMRTRALTVAGGAVTGAARVDGESGVWEITVTPDSREDLSITLARTEDCEAEGAVCTSDGRTLSAVPAHIVPGPGPETEPALTAELQGLPEAHDGEEGFHFRVAFSEDIGISFRSMRDASFTVDGGEVTGARRVEGRHDLWQITVEPDSDGDVAIALPGGRECAVSGAICTRGENRRQLANTPTATVSGPVDAVPESNTAATGTPTIGGTPQVGEALSASTSGISDADGLDNARFGYQWIRTDTDIQGATGATYTAVDADEGKELKVRVSFTDDAGHEERLTSAATDAVAARPEPLTASFEGMPAEHAGQGSFSFRVAFSDGINISYKTVRDASFTVTGGEVTAARRVDKRRDLWKITIEPASHEALTVRLPETTDCDASGAICTSDGRPLSHSLSATVAGPVGIAVADARVEEGDGVALAFVVTLSRAASAALTVDYATADGSAHAGDDYTAASGTLTFGAGERSTTIEVAVLDDAHDEGEETLTLRLSNPSGGRLADGEATGTIENHDPMPRALLARFGRTAALHVVEHVEERLQAPREPGFRGRFAGRELRRGMERDIALNFLRQLGGTAGAGPLGAGAGGSLSGAPAAGTAPFGMPGPAGGGGHLAAAGPMGGAALMGGASGSMGMAAGPMGGPAGPDGRFDGGGLLRMGLGGGDVLTGSDFALGRETGHGGILSFWSRGAQSRFAGREGALSLGGDVRTTMFGADYAKGPVVTGLSLSHSRGLGEYAGVAGGQVASSVTGLYPWLGYKATDRVTVWGVAGYGSGGLLLTPQGGPALESGLSMAMAAAGTRGELVAGGAGGFALAFKADALWVGTSIDGVDGPAGRLQATDTAVTRVRTGLEGSRAFTLAGRLSLTPSVEVGLRHDGGDAETGAGMDVGAGLIVSDASSGLAVDLRVRTLLLHQAEGFRERGMAVSLSYNPTPSTPLGFMARVAPSWGGQATSGAEALWGRQTMAGLASGGVASGNRLDGEVGYGLPVGSRFVGTPRVGVSTSEHGRDYRLGYGLAVLNRESLTFELGIDAPRRESPLVDGASNGAIGRGTVGW